MVRRIPTIKLPEPGVVTVEKIDIESIDPEEVLLIPCSSKGCGATPGQLCCTKAGKISPTLHTPRIKAALDLRAQRDPDYQPDPTATASHAALDNYTKVRAERVKFVRGGLNIVVTLFGYSATLDQVANIMVDYNLDEKILNDARALDNDVR